MYKNIFNLLLKPLIKTLKKNNRKNWKTRKIATFKTSMICFKFPTNSIQFKFNY